MMNTMLDWLSFTFPVGEEGYPEKGWNWEHIKGFLLAYIGEEFRELIGTEDMKHERGRHPYNHSVNLHSGILRVYFSGRLNHSLLEISGAGMAFLRSQQMVDTLLQKCHERTTRLDIASDIETTTTPGEFISRREGKRILASATFHSKTGTTEYIGSRTSQKFARVYRYSPPHPRSHLLRVEHELKAQAAKEASKRLLSDGIEVIQSELGVSFGWKHDDWRPNNQNGRKFKTPTNDRSAAKTEFWLRTQVAASFKKLVAQGIIENPQTWLAEVFLGDDT